MKTYYQGPLNDNYGYSWHLVTAEPLPFGAHDPWEAMENMDWVSIDTLADDDEVVSSYYSDCLHKATTDTAAEVRELYS